MRVINSIEGGLAGAVALTILHETTKLIFPRAPRLDLLGMQAISKGLRAFNAKEPKGRSLYTVALVGDIITNSLYYSLSGLGKRKGVVARGAALGLAAGLSAVTLPGVLGLSESTTNRTVTTKAMTLGLYVAGGIVASVVLKMLEKKKKKSVDSWQERLVTSSMA